MYGNTVKELTEKDFRPCNFLDEECLLTYPISSSNIASTIMEYEWSIEGKNDNI